MAKRSICFIVVLLLSATMANAYNRGRAGEYAFYWGGKDPETQEDRYNTTIYHNWTSSGGDCANFVSQCLIAGGMRFRHSMTSQNDNRSPETGSELGSGPTTRALPTNGSDNGTRAKYSRVITSPGPLEESLGSPSWVHKGVRKRGSTVLNSSDFWSRVERGDTIFQVSDHPSHGMFVHTVYAADKDVGICGHTSHRQNERLAQDIGYPDWRDDGEFWVVCLPDAPRVIGSETRVLVGTNDTDRHLIRWYWGKTDHMYGPTDHPKWYKSGELDVQITFDTKMKCNDSSAQYFKLELKTTTLTFQPLDGGGWQNGWWTNESDPPSSEMNRIQYQTWRGRISSGIPSGLNTIAPVIISATGDDDSKSDKDNELSRYNAGEMGVLKIHIDTRSGSGDTTRRM